jgi:hypothetical protein
LAKKMDKRAFVTPKGLRPRRRVKPAYDRLWSSRRILVVAAAIILPNEIKVPAAQAN